MFLFSNNSGITTSELENLLKEKPTIIDVRERGEFQSGHIPGAKNVPLGELSKLNETGKLFVICQSGMRSKRAVQLLKNHDGEVINVKGGMSKWQGKIKGGSK